MLVDSFNKWRNYGQGADDFISMARWAASTLNTMRPLYDALLADARAFFDDDTKTLGSLTADEINQWKFGGNATVAIVNKAKVIIGKYDFYYHSLEEDVASLPANDI